MSQSRTSVQIHASKKERGTGLVIQVTILTPDDVLLVFEKRDGVVKKIASKRHGRKGRLFTSRDYFSAGRDLAVKAFNPQSSRQTWHEGCGLAGTN